MSDVPDEATKRIVRAATKPLLDSIARSQATLDEFGAALRDRRSPEDLVAILRRRATRHARSA